MTALVFPDVKKRFTITEIRKADTHMCWTCRTCLAECPINIPTDGLQPLKIVRMAVLGLVDEMVILPEIWYCLTCRRCNEVCPMAVKPFLLIEYLRQEALRRGIATYQMVRLYEELLERLHRARWFIARDCREMQAGQGAPSAGREIGLATPASVFSGRIRVPQPLGPLWPSEKEKPNISACLTCGECCSVCPVFHDGEVFSPMKILRMAVLGLIDELLNSPSIWLCLGCGRCADVCSQKISIQQVIGHLQQAAVEKQIVDYEYAYRFRQAAKPLYLDYIEEVDKIFQPSQSSYENESKLIRETALEGVC